MITIKKLDHITEAPETYGYISLGTLCVNRDTGDLIDMLRPSIYKGECESSGKEFDLYLFKIGTTGNYAVLGDLTCVPGNTLVDNQELLEALKNELESIMPYLNNDYLRTEQKIFEPLNVVSTGIYTSSGTKFVSDPTKNFTFNANRL